MHAPSAARYPAVAESPFFRRRWRRRRRKLAFVLSLGGLVAILGTLAFCQFEAKEASEGKKNPSGAPGGSPLLGSAYRGPASRIARPRIIAVKIGPSYRAATTVSRGLDRSGRRQLLSEETIVQLTPSRRRLPREDAFAREMMRDFFDLETVFGSSRRSSSVGRGRMSMPDGYRQITPPQLTMTRARRMRRRSPPMILTPGMMMGMGMGWGAPPMIGFGRPFGGRAIGLDLGMVARGLSKIVGALLDLNRRWKSNRDEALSPDHPHHHSYQFDDKKGFDKDILRDMEALKFQKQQLRDMEKLKVPKSNQPRGYAGRGARDSLGTRRAQGSSNSGSSTRIPITKEPEAARNIWELGKGALGKAQEKLKMQKPHPQAASSPKTIETDKSYTFILQLAPGTRETDLHLSPRRGHLHIEDRSKAGAPSRHKLSLPADVDLQTLTRDLKDDGMLILNIQKERQSTVGPVKSPKR